MPRLDGLMGHLANNYSLSAEEVICHDNSLTKFERFFTMTKSDTLRFAGPSLEIQEGRGRVTSCMMSLCVTRILGHR